ncbi:T9SS type A sorting domain-containing protein, partial [candidate division WOR-3 bacterium]|nr:T9SS type A sorting domain-containing protein [candidate division WOR-3 bacterium]
HNALAYVAGMTGLEEKPQTVPFGLELFAGPSPASRQVRVSYAAAGTGNATVGIYDCNGRLVRALDSGPARDGRQVTWNLDDPGGQPVARGVYFCRLESGGRTLSRKVVVQR